MEDPFETVAVNYWEEVRSRLDASLNSIDKVALVIHNSAEFKDIVDLLKRLNSTKKLLYISMTKTFDSIKPHIPNIKCGVFFVDCISGGIFNDKPPKNCAFEPMPNDLTGMNSLINKSVQENNPDFVIVDSLSQFMDFSETTREHQQLGIFTEQLKRSSQKTIILYDDNISTKLKSLPNLVIDKIYRMEVIKEKINWEG